MKTFQNAEKDTTLLSAIRTISSPLGFSVFNEIKNGEVKSKEILKKTDTGERNVYIILNKLISAGIVKKNGGGVHDKTYELTQIGKGISIIMDYLNDISSHVEMVNSMAPFELNGYEITPTDKNPQEIASTFSAGEEIGRLSVFHDRKQIYNRIATISAISDGPIRYATRKCDFYTLDFIQNILENGSQLYLMISSNVEISALVYSIIGLGPEKAERLARCDSLKVRLANVSSSMATMPGPYSILEIPRPEGSDSFFYMGITCKYIHDEIANAFDSYWEKSLNIDISRIGESLKNLDIKKMM